MKQKASLDLNILSIICYGLCAAVWLRRGFREADGFYVFLGLVWLSGAVIWVVRTVRFQKINRDETENP